jgi:hypothetical protein
MQNEDSQRIKIKEEVKIFPQERVKKIRQRILLEILDEKEYKDE